MKTIYKYRLAPVATQAIFLHEGARILKVDSQHNKPFLWALVETSEERRNLLVRIICTGEEIVKSLDGWDYLGTYQLCDGDFVHHVFIRWCKNDTGTDR